MPRQEQGERRLERGGGGAGRKCKSGGDGKMSERVAVILVPAATAVKSSRCETFGSHCSN